MISFAKKFLLSLHPFLHPVLRLLLGGIFVWSGYEKLNHLEEFYRAAQAYKVLPVEITHFYSVLVPWLELLTGSYLLLGLFTRFSALITTGLYLSFLIAIGTVLANGNAVDCGCFVGGKVEPVDWDLFIRDVGLFLGATYLLLTPPSRFSLDNILDKPASNTIKTPA